MIFEHFTVVLPLNFQESFRVLGHWPVGSIHCKNWTTFRYFYKIPIFKDINLYTHTDRHPVFKNSKISLFCKFLTFKVNFGLLWWLVGRLFPFLFFVSFFVSLENITKLSSILYERFSQK